MPTYAKRHLYYLHVVVQAWFKIHFYCACFCQNLHGKWASRRSVGRGFGTANEGGAPTRMGKKRMVTAIIPM
jgi:hypothetical protein